MNGRKWSRPTVGLLLVGVLLCGGLTVYASQGTESNPLVSLSYLTDVFQPSVLEKVDQRVAESQENLDQRLQSVANQYETEIKATLDSEGTALGTPNFLTVTVTNGQRVTLNSGSEAMLRKGSAICTSTSTGLVDTTAGTQLLNGKALVANHLYLADDASHGLTATADCTLLIRGGYTLS